jgi:hypothetical protein
MEEELDIDACINISIHHFGATPSGMFSAEAVRDTLKGLVRGQAMGIRGMPIECAVLANQVEQA